MPEPHVDLVSFVDGELSDAEADSIRAHLRTCEVCVAGLSEVVQWTARLSTLPSPVTRELAFRSPLTSSSVRENNMNPESVQQIKRLLDARDLLRNAAAQYTTTIHNLQGALEHTEAALTAPADEEATRQIDVLRESVEHLSREALGTCEACRVLAEILEVLVSEVTVHEEHIPAGVS